MELKLLRGKPIEIVNVGKLYPLTLGEIDDIVDVEYNKLLGICLYNHAEEIVIEDHKLSQFEIILVYCFQDELFCRTFLSALTKFFKEEVHLHKQGGFFYLGDLEDARIIDAEKHEQIVSVIKQQNFIKEKTEDEDEFNPADEQAAELIEKLKKIRAKIKEQNQEKGLDLPDIISIVASYSLGYNLFSVWDLTVYQLYTEYIRILMKDNYESQFQIFLQGTDPDKLEMKHWSRKLEI